MGGAYGEVESNCHLAEMSSWYDPPMRNSLRIRQIVVLLITVCALSAQIAPTASLTGTVTDPSGAAVPGARIKLVNVDTGFERLLDTGAEGAYLFTQIPVGLYRVEAMASGFSSHWASTGRMSCPLSSSLVSCCQV